MVPRIEDRDVIMLSAREAEVWALLCQGLNNAEIAQRLALAEKTVKNLCCLLYKALGVRNRTEAVLVAVRQSLA